VQPRDEFGCDLGNESSRVVGSACSCLAGEDSDGSGDARVASAVRKIPPILVGMPEKVVNTSCTDPRWHEILKMMGLPV
jgi:hypothetical protein